MTTHAVIMAGGRGERLYPLSTPERPKQFLRLFGDQTMLQATAERILPLVAEDRVLVVAGAEHVPLIREQLPWLPADRAIGEPVGRNTAPCIAVAARILSARDRRSVMIALPADHLVRCPDRLRTAIETAIDTARAGEHLVTLGIPPTEPATGYGYILIAGPVTEAPGGALPVERFVEKPDRATAERYLADGGYYWNSGIFVWRVDAILAEIEHHLPELARALGDVPDDPAHPEFSDLLRRAYERISPQSIDRGVMEKSDRIRLVPAPETGWNDVGSWDALRRELARVDKPWGHEELWALNAHYVGKFLHIRAGESLSLQYHEIKDETIRVVDGTLRLRIGPSQEALEDRILRPGDTAAIPPRTVHQMEAVTDVRIAEVSTPQLADVVRLKDRYGRERPT